MNQWALATVAVLLQATVVTQAMVFVAVGLLVGDQVLRLVEVDVANQ